MNAQDDQAARLRGLLPNSLTYLFDERVSRTGIDAAAEHGFRALESDCRLYLHVCGNVSDVDLKKFVTKAFLAYEQYLHMKQKAERRTGIEFSPFAWNSSRGSEIGAHPSTPRAIAPPRQASGRPVSLSREDLIWRKLSALDRGGSRHQADLDVRIALGLAGITEHGLAARVPREAS